MKVTKTKKPDPKKDDLIFLRIKNTSDHEDLLSNSIHFTYKRGVGAVLPLDVRGTGSIQSYQYAKCRPYKSNGEVNLEYEIEVDLNDDEWWDDVPEDVKPNLNLNGIEKIKSEEESDGDSDSIDFGELVESLGKISEKLTEELNDIRKSNPELEKFFKGFFKNLNGEDK